MGALITHPDFNQQSTIYEGFELLNSSKFGVL